MSKSPLPRLRILYISQRVPYPPNKGDKLRSFNQIKFMSAFHDISLLCLSDNADDLRHKATLESFCKSVEICCKSPLSSRLKALQALFSGMPLTQGYFHSSDLQRKVKQKIKDDDFDVIFVYCSSMAQYVEDVSDVPKIIDFVDIDSEKWVQYASHVKGPLKYLYQTEAIRLKRYEKEICETFGHFFVASHKELKDFKELVLPTPNVSALLNGVDTEAFCPGTAPYDPSTLVFSGVMDYFANVETVLYFYKEILPLIRKSIPSTKFYIVGSKPVKEVLELASDPNVLVTGYVEKIQPYLQRASVFVAPMRIARGVQNKILEAMAMGVPVVTNPLGFQGVSATSGVDILVAESSAEFASQVLKLMSDPVWRGEVSLNARNTMLANYDWKRNLSGLNDVLADAVTEFQLRAGGR